MRVRPSARRRPDRARGGHDAAAGLQLRGERAGDAGEVDDPGLRRVQPGDPGGVRLELADPVRADAPQAGHAVGAAAALELVEPAAARSGPAR